MRLRMRPAATASARGTGIRNLVPAPVLDAVIAIAVAVLGLASGLGARAQHEHMPLAAIPLLALMGLALYPRRRFPAAVLTAVAAMVAALVVMRANLGGQLAQMIAAESAIIAVIGAALGIMMGLGLGSALAYALTRAQQPTMTVPAAQLVLFAVVAVLTATTTALPRVKSTQ